MKLSGDFSYLPIGKSILKFAFKKTGKFYTIRDGEEIYGNLPLAYEWLKTFRKSALNEAITKKYIIDLFMVSVVA